VVESCGRRSGHRSRVSHRPAAQRARPQAGVPRHGRGKDRRADRGQARAVAAAARGHLRAAAHRVERRRADGAGHPGSEQRDDGRRRDRHTKEDR
jgi:hypothetical protein